MRLIDADKLPVVTEWCVDEAGFGASFHVVHEEDINKAPTIDPESLRPQGEWITKSWWQRKTKYTVNVCSICKSNVKPKLKPNYCPHCGAKMYISEDIKR